MLHMFHTYVASVLSGYCVCFAIVFKWFLGAFASVSDTFSSVSFVCRRMLQLFHLDVSKVGCCTCCNGSGSWRTAAWAGLQLLPRATCLAPSPSPSPLLPPPLPSLHLASALGWGSSRVLRSEVMHSAWDATWGAGSWDAMWGQGYGKRCRR